MFGQWTASSLSRALVSADPDLAGDKTGAPDARAYDPSRIVKLEETLKRYEDHFNRHLRILMDRSVESFPSVIRRRRHGPTLTTLSV